MDLIQGLDLITTQHQGAMVTLGNFDGVHQGHQAMIKTIVQRAKAKHCPSMVILFEPQPQEFFSKEPPARLTTLEEKYHAILPLGADAILCLPFDQALSSMSAEDFVQNILIKKLAIKHILVGDDFRFGRGRAGDLALLSRMGGEFGFTTESMHSIMEGSERVSSTQVRQALAVGDLQRAARLLGRPYTLHGRVARGDERGRALGYPTANIHPGRSVLPLKGVFAVRVHGLDKVYQGMANIGTRPTVDGLKTLIEVHLFDFNDNLYDKNIEVEFCKKMRDEQKFSSLDALKAQLQLDNTNIEAYFTHG